MSARRVGPLRSREEVKVKESEYPPKMIPINSTTITTTNNSVHLKMLKPPAFGSFDPIDSYYSSYVSFLCHRTFLERTFVVVDVTTKTQKLGKKRLTRFSDIEGNETTERPYER